MKKISLFVLVLLATLAGTAQSWTVAVEKADADKNFSSAAVAVLLDSTGVSVTDNGSGSFTIHKVMRIQNERGALSHRVLVYDYDPLTASARFDNVTIYGSDGSVRQIDPSTTCDYAAPARAIYWGARQIMIELGALQPGDIVDYTIAKKGFTYALLADIPSDDDERFVPPMRGEFYDIVPFWVDYPTVKKVYSVSVPDNKPVQYEFYQGECRSSIRKVDGRKLLTFSVSMAMPFKSEKNMVALYDVAPKLMLSSTDKWQDKSLWFYNVNEDYGSFEPLPEAQKKVDALLKGVKDDMQKISILTHWVADNMRYSGIPMGKGEGYTLHNTKMNFTDRCGVCKDKAALLISMLRMAGFEAYPAMTMAGSRIETIPADHFNHCVTVVKLKDGTYMPLDPTWVPFKRELWSSAEQQQNYLPGIPEGSDLCLTPVSDPMNHYLKISAESKLSADGTLTGSFVVRAEGQSDGSVRAPFLQGYADRIYRSLESQLLAVSPLATLESYSCKEPKNYQKAPIELKMTFTIPQYATVGDGVMMCKPLVFSGLYSGVCSFLRVDTKAEEREHAFKDACSRYVELKETMTLPKGYKMLQQPKSVSVEGNVAKAAGTLEQKGNKLCAEQYISLGKRVYEAAEWGEFRAAVNAFKEMTNSMLVLEKK